MGAQPRRKKIQYPKRGSTKRKEIAQKRLEKMRNFTFNVRTPESPKLISAIETAKKNPTRENLREAIKSILDLKAILREKIRRAVKDELERYDYLEEKYGLDKEMLYIKLELMELRNFLDGNTKLLEKNRQWALQKLRELEATGGQEKK